jgi:hypothetical protein
MSIEFSNKPGKYDAGAIMEVASMIGLDNLTNNDQGSYQNISFDNISLWNDWPIHYFGSGSCHISLCPLSDSTLLTVDRHDSAKKNQPFSKNNTNEISSS